MKKQPKILNPNTPISEIEFSVRTKRMIDNLKIKTVSQLSDLSANELLKLRNFGIRSIAEINMTLRPYGLILND